MSRNWKPGAAPAAAPGADDQDAPPPGKKSLTAMLPPPLPQGGEGEHSVPNVAGLAGRGPDLLGLPGARKPGQQEPDEPVPARRPPPPVKAERERELPPPAAAAPAPADDPFALHIPAAPSGTAAPGPMIGADGGTRPRPPVAGLPPRGEAGGPLESEDVSEED